MLLGFISLLLTVGQGQIAKICVSEAVANSWHPCDKKHEKSKDGVEKEINFKDNGHRRRLLYSNSDHGGVQRRVLAGVYDICTKKVWIISVSYIT